VESRRESTPLRTKPTTPTKLWTPTSPKAATPNEDSAMDAAKVEHVDEDADDLLSQCGGHYRSA
jgi:hypothetical protein